jgi:hypothetical protein
MATSLRLPDDMAEDIRQLAEDHTRSEHKEMLYGLKFYIRACRSASVEKIVSAWLAEMQDGKYGKVTPSTLYSVIQEHCTHPDKRFVLLEDCSYVDQREIDEMIRKNGAIIL